MFHSLRQRLTGLDRDVWFFMAAIAAAGFAQSMLDSTFNNFLNETFRLTNLQRSILEVPRELPGILVVFISAGFFFLCNRRLAAVAMTFAALGLTLIAAATFSFPLMLVWLFVYSVGQHIFLPLNSSIGMELAKAGQTGRRLGQFNALRNLVTVVGSFVILIGFKYLRFSFTLTFFLAAAGFAAAALLLLGLRPNQPQPASLHLTLHREYRLFYWLSILYGTRKQIFLTFAPWVLVTIYHQPTQKMATLLTLGGIAGILFQPLLGKLVDSVGERVVLTGEAVVLIAVCLLYGFSDRWFQPAVALLVVSACYIADQLLMSVGMARATYLKKIALRPADINAALTAATSLDHIFSVATAVLSGFIWKAWGYQYVFLLGAGIAGINAFSTLRIVIPVTAGKYPSSREPQPSGFSPP
jgi:predicted MFS family arabinose efflux permease